MPACLLAHLPQLVGLLRTCWGPRHWSGNLPACLPLPAHLPACLPACRCQPLPATACLPAHLPACPPACLPTPTSVPCSAFARGHGGRTAWLTWRRWEHREPAVAMVAVASAYLACQMRWLGHTWHPRSHVARWVGMGRQEVEGRGPTAKLVAGCSAARWVGGSDAGCSAARWVGGSGAGCSAAKWVEGSDAGCSAARWVGGGDGPETLASCGLSNSEVAVPSTTVQHDSPPQPSSSTHVMDCSVPVRGQRYALTLKPSPSQLGPPPAADVSYKAWQDGLA